MIKGWRYVGRSKTGRGSCWRGSLHEGWKDVTGPPNDTPPKHQKSLEGSELESLSWRIRGYEFRVSKRNKTHATLRPLKVGVSVFLSEGLFCFGGVSSDCKGRLLKSHGVSFPLALEFHPWTKLKTKEYTAKPMVIGWIYPTPRMPVTNEGLGWDSRT